MAIRIYPIWGNDYQIYKAQQEVSTFQDVYSNLVVMDLQDYILGPLDVSDYFLKSVIIKVHNTGHDIYVQPWIGSDSVNMIPYDEERKLDSDSSNGIFFNVYTSFFGIKARTENTETAVCDVIIMSKK